MSPSLSLFFRRRRALAERAAPPCCRAPPLQTLGLMVKNTIHKTKKMSLRYFFNGAMPSEQTENNIKIAQVRLSSSEQQP